MPENTRVVKGENSYTVLVASAESEDIYSKLNLQTDDGSKIVFQFGDHAKDFTKIVQELENALPYVANETQKDSSHTISNHSRRVQWQPIRSHKLNGLKI